MELELSEDDKQLLVDIQVEADRVVKNREERLEKLRVPLAPPDEEEMARILSDFRPIIVQNPKIEFTFFSDRDMSPVIPEWCLEWEWLNRPLRWHLLYKKKIGNNYEERDFARIYVSEQLDSYFLAIINAWNAKYKAVQLTVPVQGRAWCRFVAEKKK